MESNQPRMDSSAGSCWPLSWVPIDLLRIIVSYVQVRDLKKLFFTGDKTLTRQLMAHGVVQKLSFHFDANCSVWPQWLSSLSDLRELHTHIPGRGKFISVSKVNLHSIPSSVRVLVLCSALRISRPASPPLGSGHGKCFDFKTHLPNLEILKIAPVPFVKNVDATELLDSLPSSLKVLKLDHPWKIPIDQLHLLPSSLTELKTGICPGAHTANPSKILAPVDRMHVALEDVDAVQFLKCCLPDALLHLTYTNSDEVDLEHWKTLPRQLLTLCINGSTLSSSQCMKPTEEMLRALPPNLTHLEGGLKLSPSAEGNPLTWQHITLLPRSLKVLRTNYVENGFGLPGLSFNLTPKNLPQALLLLPPNLTDFQLSSLPALGPDTFGLLPRSLVHFRGSRVIRSGGDLSKLPPGLETLEGAFETLSARDCALLPLSLRSLTIMRADMSDLHPQHCHAPISKPSLLSSPMIASLPSYPVVIHPTHSPQKSAIQDEGRPRSPSVSSLSQSPGAKNNPCMLPNGLDLMHGSHLNPEKMAEIQRAHEQLDCRRRKSCLKSCQIYMPIRPFLISYFPRSVTHLNFKILSLDDKQPPVWPDQLETLQLSSLVPITRDFILTLNSLQSLKTLDIGHSVVELGVISSLPRSLTRVTLQHFTERIMDKHLNSLPSNLETLIISGPPTEITQNGIASLPRTLTSISLPSSKLERSVTKLFPPFLEDFNCPMDTDKTSSWIKEHFAEKERLEEQRCMMDTAPTVPNGCRVS